MLEKLISDTDNSYNFIAFTVDKVDNAAPYLSQAYTSIALFFTSYSLEIQLVMVISILLGVLGISYMIYQLSHTTKKHRKLHLHEFAGFEYKKDK